MAWVEEHFPAPEEMRTVMQKVLTAIIMLILRGVTSFGNGKKSKWPCEFKQETESEPGCQMKVEQ
jgi:hypothetical protein